MSAVGGAIGIARKITTPKAMAIPVVGTLALAGFSFWLDAITDWRLSIFGLMILFVVYYLQDGIVGFVRGLFFNKRRLTSLAEVAPMDVSRDAIKMAGNTGHIEPGQELLSAKGVLMQFGLSLIHI